MMPKKIIAARKPSAPAICRYEIGRSTDSEGVSRPWICAAPMRLEIKTPKIWSYQERVSERCSLGHISHGQAVLND